MGPEHGPEETARLVQSAEAGDTEAQLHLGTLYACGFGGMEQSTTEAAEQGDAEGQFCLVLLYGLGAGVEQDFAKSVDWYRLAAEQGHGPAQGRLGDIYAHGEGGVRPDPAAADTWYRLPARAEREVTVVAGREYTSGREIGFHLLVLGTMYRDGVAVLRNDVAAHKWLNIAEKRGGRIGGIKGEPAHGMDLEAAGFVNQGGKGTTDTTCSVATRRSIRSKLSEKPLGRPRGEIQQPIRKDRRVVGRRSVFRRELSRAVLRRLPRQRRAGSVQGVV